MDLSTLRRQGELFLQQLAEAELNRFAGAPPINFINIYGEFTALSSEETFAGTQAAFRGARDDATRHSSRKLMGLSSRALLGRRTQAFQRARSAFEDQAAVTIEGETIAAREVLWRAANEADRELGGRMARAFELSLGELEDPLSRTVEACRQIASELGYSSWGSLISEVMGLDLGVLLAEAEAVLQSTEDPYRDLVQYALRKTTASVVLWPHGDAGEHDLLRFGRLLPLDDLFPARHLASTAQRLFEEMGLPSDASGRLSLRLEGRPAKLPGALVAGLQIPADVVVALGPLGGAQDYRALLHALGQAYPLTSISPEAPFEDRFLGDRSANEGFGFCFERLLIDPGFLGRHLNAKGREAWETARLIAIDALARLRKDCARLIWDHALFSEGPRAELRSLYGETLRRALKADWPAGRWLWDAEPWFDAAHRLQGLGLEAVLHAALLETANEDYWRNPKTGSFLKRLFAQGQQEGAAAITKKLGSGLSVQNAADRLIEIAAR
jgi:hypothetical protein